MCACVSACVCERTSRVPSFGSFWVVEANEMLKRRKRHKSSHAHHHCNIIRTGELLQPHRQKEEGKMQMLPNQRLRSPDLYNDDDSVPGDADMHKHTHTASKLVAWLNVGHEA